MGCTVSGMIVPACVRGPQVEPGGAAQRILTARQMQHCGLFCIVATFCHRARVRLRQDMCGRSASAELSPLGLGEHEHRSATF